MNKMSHIPYYGGKYRLSKYISQIIQKINPLIYAEPYAGGASVFFSLSEYNRVYVLNDANRCLNAMYRAFKRYPKSMKKRIDETPYSHEDHIYSKNFISSCSTHELSKEQLLNVAVNTYISLCMSVSYIMGTRTGWRMGKTTASSEPKKWKKRKDNIDHIIKKLDDVYLDAIDGIKFIQRWDHSNALFYIDCPYPGTNCGHYNSKNRSYSVDIFDQNSWKSLCETLNTIKGSYILSNYDNDIEPLNYKYRIEIPHQKSNGISAPSKSVEILWIKCDDPENIYDFLVDLFPEIVTINRNP